MATSTQRTRRNVAKPGPRRGSVPDAKRTSARLSQDLIKQARQALGTRGVTDTLTRAMEEVVRLQHRIRILATELPDLTPESVDAMREPRSFAGSTRESVSPKTRTKKAQR